MKQEKLMNELQLRVEIETWPRLKPLKITGYTFDSVKVIVVTLSQGQHVGRGEAAGAYYKNEDVHSMLGQIESVRRAIEAGISRDDLQELLPSGGARNALDCALWDLDAKLSGRHAWQIAGIGEPRPLLTTFTCGADEPEQMVHTVRAFNGARALKLKLTGDPIDADRVCAVREAVPHVWLSVDANQGFTRKFLERLMPVLIDNKVALIEQPFPIGEEALLDGFRSPISIAADESAQDLSSLPRLVGRFSMANIKLDKCGGLTQGFVMARALREHGLGVMVGCMGGTSLAMAPAILLGQLCDVVDLDGPVFLSTDRLHAVRYVAGEIVPPQALWGAPISDCTTHVDTRAPAGSARS
jgi:L-Ala-D/L-Glu epimerase